MRSKSLISEYWHDWLVAVVLFAFGGVCAGFIAPAVPAFSLSDPALMTPEKTSAVSSALLLALGFGVPVVCIPLAHVLSRQSTRALLHHGLLGALTAIAVQQAIQGTASVVYGEPRPSFLLHLTCTNGTGEAGCTGLPEDDALRRSFFSGHASLSMASFLFTSLFVALPPFLNTFDRTHLYLWKIVVFLVPIQGSILIGLTRLRDARHHPSDVLIGLFCGALSALLAFTMYFEWGTLRIRARQTDRDPLDSKQETALEILPATEKAPQSIV